MQGGGVPWLACGELALPLQATRWRAGELQASERSWSWRAGSQAPRERGLSWGEGGIGPSELVAPLELGSWRAGLRQVTQVQQVMFVWGAGACSG